MTVTPTTRCASCGCYLNFRERVTGLCRSCDPRTMDDPAVGRVLQCTGPCGQRVRVLEAAHGATSPAGHRHLNPLSFRCGDCIDAEVLFPARPAPSGSVDTAGAATGSFSADDDGSAPGDAA